jgi:hypothetical protein
VVAPSPSAYVASSAGVVRRLQHPIRSRLLSQKFGGSSDHVASPVSLTRSLPLPSSPVLSPARRLPSAPTPPPAPFRERKKARWRRDGPIVGADAPTPAGPIASATTTHTRSSSTSPSLRLFDAGPADLLRSSDMISGCCGSPGGRQPYPLRLPRLQSMR